jgi:hypothetical protein
MKRMYMVTLMALVAGMSFPVPAMAVLDVNVDFFTVPTDIAGDNWTTSGSQNPEPNVNTVTGIWTNDRGCCESSIWAYSAILADHPISGAATHIQGEAEISHTTISGDVRGNDITLVNWSKNSDWQVRVHVKPNLIRVVQLGDQNNFADVPIDNSNSTLHTYGWDLNLSTKKARVYFDDVQVGLAGGYDVNHPGAGNSLSFGDISGGGTSGVHHEDWHNWRVGEGSIPEPATMALMGLGGGLMLLRRRRRA